VAIELVAAIPETPDVFGWNYWTTVLVEVKTSRADFMADAKKEFRQNPEQGVGERRYYCCPAGLILTDELPEKWGLLYEANGVLTVIKKAERQVANYKSERIILSSILRREGIKPKIFNYRKNKL
jgi:hypothetical protein